MVICHDCKLKDAGCAVKDAVIASGSKSCSFYSVQKMEKLADSTEEAYTISWDVGDTKIVHITMGGRVVNSKILSIRP